MKTVKSYVTTTENISYNKCRKKRECLKELRIKADGRNENSKNSML
jgi:hypothetical protein